MSESPFTPPTAGSEAVHGSTRFTVGMMDALRSIGMWHGIFGGLSGLFSVGAMVGAVSLGIVSVGVSGMSGAGASVLVGMAAFYGICGLFFGAICWQLVRSALAIARASRETDATRR